MNVAKILKITGITLITIILTLALIVGSYVLYLTCQYYRIEDNQNISITNNQAQLIQTQQEYSITTYNIGFGAYSQDFTFFMDYGEFKDGTKVSGTGSRAFSKTVAERNTNGAIRTIVDQNVDFAFFQEVDTEAHRSYFINQYESIQNNFAEYSSNFAVNFHSGYLFYPLTNPHGTVNAGIATLSKYKIDSVTRKSLPIDESFPTKFFDLDRCFSINRLPIENSDKQLVLINLHCSAYDEGGVYRAKQLQLIREFISNEYAQGNYVIAGGDWNHDIADTADYFPTDMKKPDWVAEIKNENLPEHFAFATAKNVPTCRSTDIPYTKKEDGTISNYTVVIDGFIVSDNIEVTLTHNLDTDFKYSDHNPVLMKFKLK